MNNAWLWASFLTLSVAAVILFRARSAIQVIKDWPQTRGFVQPDSIVLQRAGWSPSAGMKGLYVTSVSFEYEVNGKKYKGSRIMPVGWTIREEEKDRFRAELENYSNVLYDQSNPENAYLDVPDRFQHGSISWITIFLVIVGSCLVFLGAFLLTNAF